MFFWSWATTIPNIYYNKMKQLVNYGIDLNPITMSDIYIKKKLTTSYFINTNKIQIIECISITAFLTKAIYVLPRETKSCIIYYSFYNI